MYLDEAEATPELRHHVLAYTPAKIDYTHVSRDTVPSVLAYYLCGVRRLVRLPLSTQLF